MRAKLGLTATLATAVALLATAIAPAPAAADFGLKGFDVAFTNEDGTSATQAGSHPFAITTTYDVNYTTVNGEFVEHYPDGDIKDLIVEQVEGFVGDATAVPSCSTIDFLTHLTEGDVRPACPDSTAVGQIAVAIYHPSLFQPSAVFNLQPPPGIQVRLGFNIRGVPVIIDIGVKDTPGYNVTAMLKDGPQPLQIYGAKLRLWGNPASPKLDHYRGNECWAGETFVESAAEVRFEPSANTCLTNVPDRPFLTLPRRCSGPLPTAYRAVSWQEPGKWITGSSLTHDDAAVPNPQGFTGCGKLGFSPRIASQASTDSAETGTGLDFDINFNDEGLQNPEGIAQSDVKKTVVTLPEGVTINPSIGEGLGVCTPADYERESLDIELSQGCPNSSKIGTVLVETPLIDNSIEGSVYLAQQDDPRTSTRGAENPFDSLVAFYIILRSEREQILVKVPAKVEPDPKTGQLVTTVDDIPQFPFSRFNFHFREGQRAALVSPPACGTYTTKAEMTPWARPDETLTTTSSFKITRGIGGGPCPPGGIPSFNPGFEAGSLNNNAKAYSPFDMRLIRNDGEQDMTKFSSILPPGVLGKLAGISKCSDVAIAASGAKTGLQELASPSCPLNSMIGHTLAGAGVGGALTYVPGQLYLGGPYKGDPLSVVSVTPAVAGPFDAGTVVVRLALTLNPETAEVEVDGANSDPIPHILKGIPLKLRDLRVHVDRKDFIVNPTSCDPSSAKAVLFGSYLDVFSPADDRPVDLATRYQAANCLNLPFKPRLSLQLKGGTKRGGHPALHAVVNAKPNDANFGSAVVTLPKSAFLDQAHIRTICTRVQFAAKNCPKGAQYGYAKAWTPLLDEAIEGPVYLRSSNHKLPDLVAALHGLVDVNIVGRIDSFKGGIRSSFETIPDAPVTKFVLDMQGGKKGLVVNSRNLCAGKNRANARFVGQNGKPYNFNPVVKPSCGGGRKR